MTNAGSNIAPEVAAHYGISVLPVRIVAGNESRDVREVTLEDVDTWVRNESRFPYLLGTSAAEFAAHFLAVGKRDPNVLVLMTSRKLMQSYDSARAAVRTVKGHPQGEALQLEVVDTAATDVASGLSVIYAAEAQRAGQPFEALRGLTEAFAARVRSVFAVRTLENITLGGRASFLKAWIANVLKVRPLLTLEDGEIVPMGRYPAEGDPVEFIVQGIVERVGDSPGPIWLAIGHGGCPEDARRLTERLRARFDVQFVLHRPLAAGVYLHGGPGSLIASVARLDGLPWEPTRCPPVSSVVSP